MCIDKHEACAFWITKTQPLATHSLTFLSQHHSHKHFTFFHPFHPFAMSDDNTAQSEPIRNHETWIDGDFEVITADGVRFRVPSFHLFAAR